MEGSSALTCFGLLATILCVDLIVWTFELLLMSCGETKKAPKTSKKKTPSRHQRIGQQASVLIQGMSESPNHNPAAQVGASLIFLQGYCQSRSWKYFCFQPCAHNSCCSEITARQRSTALVSIRKEISAGQDGLGHAPLCIHHTHLLDQASYQRRNSL